MQLNLNCCGKWAVKTENRREQKKHNKDEEMLAETDAIKETIISENNVNVPVHYRTTSNREKEDLLSGYLSL